jgi:glycosyltransferase involved in cell wall biosynthesis
MDSDDPILSHSVDWVAEFAKEFELVFVYTTHRGRFEVPKNVIVIEIGGGDFGARLLGLVRLIRSLSTISKYRDKIAVFHHMTTKPLAIIGMAIKLMKVKQYLWFSHSCSDIYLKVGAKYSDLIFTPTSNTFPLDIPGKKLVPIGHGVNLQNREITKLEDSLFPTLLSGNRRKFKIVVLGRISPIKNIEVLIEFLTSRTHELKSFEVSLIGPIFDYDYWRKINVKAYTGSLQLTYAGTLKGAELGAELSSANFIFNGMLKSIDKSAIIAGINGCFLISQNSELMETFYEEILSDPFQILHQKDLSEQLEVLLNLPDYEAERVRRVYIENLRKRFDLRKLIDVIIGDMKRSK